MTRPFKAGYNGAQAIVWLNDLYERTEAQAFGASGTSLTIGAGPKTLNVGASKMFAVGQTVKVVDTADIDGRWMLGTVTAYDITTGVLAVDVATISGAGEGASWVVSLAGSPGPQGRGVELQTSATHIQWRYVGDTDWIDLVPLADLHGDPGREVELRSTVDFVQWRYAGDVAWTDLVPLADLRGREVELQTSATHIQWRYVGAPAWADLIALSALTGDAGKSAYEAWLDEGNEGTEEDFLASLQGDPGTRGWSQILGNVPDGARVVQRIVDWVGGTGVKPPVGDYLSLGGPVSDIALATDVRGAGGSGSGDVSGPSGATAGRLVAFADGTGKVLAEGPAISEFATAAQGGKADSAVQPGSLGTAAALTAGAANGVATLDASGKVPSSQMPPIAITETFVVATQAAQLALTAQEGDVAVRTDLSKSFIKNSGTSGSMSDWSELLTPGAPVQSVNGKTGSVSLSAADVGAKPAGYAPSAAEVAGPIDAAAAKAVPVDADQLPLLDSAASNGLKKFTWANLKATLKTYFDGLYAAVGRDLPAGGATGQVLAKSSVGDYAVAWVNGGGSGYETGDIVLSARSLTAPDYLDLNTVYLQSSYPDLSGVVGIIGDGAVANTKLANPANLPAGNGRSCAWDPSGTFLAVAHNTSPRITIYQRSGTTFTKLANPAALPTGDGCGCAWDPSGTFLAVTHVNSPYLTIYERSGTTFTKLANPATLPTDTSISCAWDPSGTFLAVAHNTSRFLTIYQRSGTTFTKLADPATLPTGHGRGCAFDPSGAFLAVAHNTSPYVTIYQRSGTTFTKLADPSSLPTGGAENCAWDPSGTFLAVTQGTSPFIHVYQRDGTTFTKLADPATLPTGAGSGCSWDPSGKFLAIAHNITPFVTIYERDGTTFTKRANPASLPTGLGWGCEFDQSGAYLAIGHTTSPFITIYQNTSYDTGTQFLTPARPPAVAGAVWKIKS